MNLKDIQNKISPILSEYGIKYAGVFGSVSRGETDSKSDIDILIRLGKPMGIFSYMAMIRTIEELLGRKVDLVTYNSLNKFLAPYILKEVKTIYEG